MSGRWPLDWGVPSIDRIQQALCGITLLVRMKNSGRPHSGEYLCAVCLNKLDIYETNIVNHADIKWRTKEIKGLKVRFAYPAVVPIAGRYPGDLHVTLEDIFANISIEDLPNGTFIEVFTRFVKIDIDEKLGKIWRPIILVYDKES